MLGTFHTYVTHNIPMWVGVVFGGEREELIGFNTQRVAGQGLSGQYFVREPGRCRNKMSLVYPEMTNSTTQFIGHML